MDKTAWGPGPWQSEPDRAEWRSNGLPCLIVRSEATGSLCGYVGLSEGHPWFERDYVDIPAEVHGGFTYAGHCSGHICHVPEPGEPDHVWWIGFDCGHAFDLQPGLVASMADLGLRSLPLLSGWEYRDLPYVRACVEALALQAHAALV